MDNYFVIFLLINALFIGVIGTLALQHAMAHFKPEKKSRRKADPKQHLHIPNALRQQLLEQSEKEFQSVLNRSAKELEHDLNIVIERIDKQVEKFSTEIVKDETKRYRDSLDGLRKQTESSMLNAEVEISKHQIAVEEKIAQRKKELEDKLTKDIKTEKDRRINQINNSLSDALTSFLLETLGHNVDLGAQSDYLIKTLEANKAELIKGISNEA